MNRRFLFIVLILSLPIVSACPRINEVMVRGTEWVEIYNPNAELLNLSEWQIKDNYATDKLNTSAVTNAAYFLIIAQNTSITNITSEPVTYFYVDDSKIGNGLADSGDNVNFYNQNCSSNFVYTSSQADKSWSFCDGNWLLSSATPGKQNNCRESSQAEEEPSQEEPVFEQISKPTGKTAYEIQAPYRIESGKEFITRVLIQNKYSTKKEFTAWSYVYKEGKCYSCNKSREENSQSSILEPKSFAKIYLRNIVQDAREGNYSFKVSIIPEGFEKAKTFYFDLELRNEKNGKTERGNESVLNSSAQFKKTEESSIPITGDVIYKSRGFNARDRAYWLFLILCISLLLYLILKKERKDVAEGKEVACSIHN